MATVGATNTVYACVTKDGLYASRNGGKSWELAFSGNVHSVAVDPNNSQVVYAGTEPVALFRSSDCGRSWTDIERAQQSTGKRDGKVVVSAVSP